MHVKLKNVCLQVEGENERIINSASCEIECGETIALMGPSGCGKSSLFEIISGFRKATSGRVELASVGEPVGSRLGRIGYLPQHSSDLILPWKTVEGNLRLVCRLHRKDSERPPFSSEALLEETGLIRRRNRYPAVLSGGERRLLVLAMILSFCPRLILLDEPFTGLDLDLKLTLWTLLHLYCVRRKPAPTVLLITHNLDEAAILSDRVIFFRKRDAIASIYEARPRSEFASPPTTDPADLYQERLRVLPEYIAYLDRELCAVVGSP